MELHVFDDVRQVGDSLNVAVDEDVHLVLLVFAEIEQLTDGLVTGEHFGEVVLVVDIVHGTQCGNSVVGAEGG